VGAVEMTDAFDVDRLRAWFIERGVFIRPLGRVIYLSPAYTIADDDLAQLTAAVRKAVGALPV
jgi:adenosylmethionine-8-amino-7-oxononanoate aminotransferase